MILNIVVAFSKNFAIGNNNELPWNITEDLAWFANLTRNNVVVMGRKTWDSLPSGSKPLKNRVNVVTTSTPEEYTAKYPSVIFIPPEDLDSFLKILYPDSTIFIIGGVKLYQTYVGKADRIYVTYVDKAYKADAYFPYENMYKYYLEESSEDRYSSEEACNYRYLTYKLSNNQTLIQSLNNSHKNSETAYLEHATNIINNGHVRTDRTNIGTLSIFAPNPLRFDLTTSFPLLTTKFVGFKSIAKELLFFIKGQTDSKILETQGVNIWKANTTEEFLKSRNLPYHEGDMGPMYGFNWRHFGAEYKGANESYEGQGYDQLQNLIESIKKDPDSRRHLLTTFNPSTVDQSVLAPCHGIITQFYVNDNHLSCHTYIRSSDTFLGLPYNIASYALLTHIIAAYTGKIAQELVISFGDAHVYQNHLEQVKLQTSRHPLPFPKLRMTTDISKKSLNDLEIDDFVLEGYIYHPTIKAPMAI